MNKEQALQKIKELEEYIENLDKKDSRWKPSMHDKYWFNNADGDSFNSNWVNTESDKRCLKIGNCYPTRELAELHALRLEAMANRWLPDEDETYYYWDFYNKGRDSSEWNEVHLDLEGYIIGNTHRTEKEAEEWGKKYDKAFRVLWEDK